MLTGFHPIVAQANEKITGILKKGMEEDKTGLTTIAFEMASTRFALREKFSKIYHNPKQWNSAEVISFLHIEIQALIRRKEAAKKKFHEFSSIHQIDTRTVKAIQQRMFQSSHYTKTPEEKLNWLYGAIGHTQELINQCEMSLLERQISLEEMLAPEENKHVPESTGFAATLYSQYRNDFSTFRNSEKAAQIPLNVIVSMLYRHNGEGVCGSAGHEFSSLVCSEVVRRIRNCQSLSELGAHTINSIVDFFETNTGLELLGNVLTTEINALSQLQVAAFKKIYSALREGQSSFFKKTNFLLGKESLSVTEMVGEIERYSQLHPNSRTKKAWDLAKIHPRQCSHDNTRLFTEIYMWSFEKSRFFKQSLVTGQQFFWSSTFNQNVTQLTVKQIQDGAKKKNSRTANIYSALGRSSSPSM